VLSVAMEALMNVVIGDGLPGLLFCLLVIHVTCNLIHVYLCLSGIILADFNFVVFVCSYCWACQYFNSCAVCVT
jgi:hypothetical protein